MSKKLVTSGEQEHHNKAHYPPKNEHRFWKWKVGKTSFLLERPIFRGASGGYVSFSECSRPWYVWDPIIANYWGLGAIVFVQAPNVHKDTNPQELQCTSHGWIEIRNQTYNSKCQSWRKCHIHTPLRPNPNKIRKCSFGKGKSLLILYGNHQHFWGSFLVFGGGTKYQIKSVSCTIHCEPALLT